MKTRPCSTCLATDSRLVYTAAPVCVRSRSLAFASLHLKGKENILPAGLLGCVMTSSMLRSNVDVDGYKLKAVTNIPHCLSSCSPLNLSTVGPQCARCRGLGLGHEDPAPSQGTGPWAQKRSFPGMVRCEGDSTSEARGHPWVSSETRLLSVKEM